MCFANQGATHACVPECPACYVFTLESLQLIASAGANSSARVSLGTLEGLIPAAEQGCQFCIFLLTVAIGSGQPWAQGATVAIVPVESHNRNTGLQSGQIDKIRLRVTDPFTLNAFTGGSSSERVFHDYSVDLGIHSTTPELKELLPRTPADPQVATPQVFEQVETWLENCLEDHVDCPRSTNTPLPTRVIDVGTSSSVAGASDNVRLHISSSNECGRYSALSYCWGVGNQVRTLKQNLEQHTAAIQVTSLPQTIQDAIRVTRELKIRYLWVDALCIIQDSLDDDWPREAARMGGIYKNAVVTISAADAVESSQGFLEDRQSVLLSQLQAFRFPVFWFAPDPDEASEEVESFESVGEVFLTRDAEQGYTAKKFRDENINARAWTLQESWLSPRVLSFGSGLPQWICLTHTKAYGADREELRYSWDKTDQVRRQIFKKDPSLSGASTEIGPPIHGTLDRTDYLREWSNLYINYSRRNMTVKTDKMVAISGIAQEFAKLLDDEYAAGLWLTSLPHSLLWRHDNDFQEESPPPEKRRKRDRFLKFFAPSRNGSSSASSTNEPWMAPSWSPFANTGPVLTNMPYSALTSPTLCVINELEIEPANAQAPFLAVKPDCGWLAVTAPMAQMSYEELATFFVIVTEGAPHIYWDAIVPDGGATNPFLGRVAKLQAQYPDINPQILVETKITSGFALDPPLVQETAQRPVPPSMTTSPWPARIKIKKCADAFADADFWLLEIAHTVIPTGLVLNRLRTGKFERVGMFRMGRNQDPNWLWVNGREIAGPRRWDWDSKLALRTCVIT